MLIWLQQLYNLNQVLDEQLLVIWWTIHLSGLWDYTFWIICAYNWSLLWIYVTLFCSSCFWWVAIKNCKTILFCFLIIVSCCPRQQCFQLFEQFEPNLSQSDQSRIRYIQKTPVLSTWDATTVNPQNYGRSTSTCLIAI